MKAKASKVVELNDSMKEECTLVNKQHRWLWVSIFLLAIGQVSTFIYVTHSQNKLLENYYKKGATYGSTNEDISFASLSNSSVNEKELVTEKLELVPISSSKPRDTLRRNKRSSPGKPQKHSNKVSE